MRLCVYLSLQESCNFNWELENLLSFLCQLHTKDRTFSHLPNWWAVSLGPRRPLLKGKKNVRLFFYDDKDLIGSKVLQLPLILLWLGPPCDKRVCPRKFGGPYASDSPIPRRTRGLLPPPLSKRPWGMQPRSDKRTRTRKRPGLRGTSDTPHQDTLGPTQSLQRLGTKCPKMFPVLWLQSLLSSDWSNIVAFTWCFDGRLRFHSPLSAI